MTVAATAAAAQDQEHDMETSDTDSAATGAIQRSHWNHEVRYWQNGK